MATDAREPLYINTTLSKPSASFQEHSSDTKFQSVISTSSRSLLPSPIPSPLPIYSPYPSLHGTSESSASQHDLSFPDRIELSGLRANLICSWLYQKQLEKKWSSGRKGEGVMLRKGRNEYICCPPELQHSTTGLYKSVAILDAKCAMTISTHTTTLVLELTNASSMLLSDGSQLPILLSMEFLVNCPKAQSAAFLRNPPLLVVWGDSPGSLIDRAIKLETQMMNMVWDGRCQERFYEDTPSRFDKYTEPFNDAVTVDSMQSAPRKTILVQPIIVACTLLIMCIALGSGWWSIAVEVKVEQQWLYILFPIVGPLQAWLGLFFFQTLPTCVAQIIGPVYQMKQNSTSFSSKPPPRLRQQVLPHVTIQCPLYKESLALVIEPTMKSIQAAIATYEAQGGSASIFVNDDGMQVIASEEAQLRRDFYEESCIGWVARPRHNFVALDSKKAFVRAGKFKKASNLNYCLNISIRIEEKLSKLRRSDEWTRKQEQYAYGEALAEVLREDQGLTWASGDVRVGDYVLLVDSDTRIPQDCLLDAVSEMEQSPSVAIIQFSSSVLNITESWFEKGITFFTHLVYTAIEFAVANGDVAPFVGHNAIMRWSALQDVAVPASDYLSYQKFWSEDTVSEDFDMALRLQTSGYSLRLATYAKAGFKEGVSLTVYDELARWEKYAYGCSELIFHPFILWFRRGPFTPLFRRFIFSGMPLHSKISIMAYIGTYFAIASSWLLTLLNYFLVGWFNGYLDHYYMESFRIYFSVFLLFNFIGNIALAILRYRIDEKPLIASLLENFKWILLLSTFMGGMSLHISQAILCHLFSIDMSWGATSKEAKSTSFFHEIPIVLRKFRITFLMCLSLTAVMVVLAGVGPFQDLVPYHWQITQFTAIFPLALMVASHALLPLALNPGLMQFTF